MAKPIQLDFPTRDKRAELEARLREAPAEHAGALLDLLALVEVLHERNVLNTLRGAVGAGESLIEYLAASAAEPESIRAVRNLLALSKILGKIDPEFFNVVYRAIPKELEDASLRRATPAPSLWAIAKVFWSPGVRRGLMVGGLLLAGVGYYMNKERPSTADEA